MDPSDGVFGRFDLAALGGCHTLNNCYVCYVMLSYISLHTTQEVYFPRARVSDCSGVWIHQRKTSYATSLWDYRTPSPQMNADPNASSATTARCGYRGGTRCLFRSPNQKLPHSLHCLQPGNIHYATQIETATSASWDPKLQEQLFVATSMAWVADGVAAIGYITHCMKL